MQSDSLFLITADCYPPCILDSNYPYACHAGHPVFYFFDILKRKSTTVNNELPAVLLFSIYLTIQTA